jgi:hypothetical protein
MADPQRRPTDTTVQPAGVEGEGLDPYPTYRDGPVSPHHATGTKPTDVGLPPGRRSYWMPFFIALVVFGLIILARILWSGAELATSSDEALTPEPAASETTATSPDAAPPVSQDEQSATEGAPGAVNETPGAIDVPGGETTDPVRPEPAQ